MIDYIKRSDAINAVYEEWEEWIYYDGSGREIASDTEDALCRLDAEDVAPVRHGMWEDYEENTWQCSECGELFYLEDGTPQENEYRYCPNCGAKMDGERSE